MLFKDERGLPETGCPDTGGQAGQAAADYDKLIISQQRSDGKVSQLTLPLHGHADPHRGAIANCRTCTNPGHLIHFTILYNMKTHSYIPCDQLRSDVFQLGLKIVDTTG